MWTIESIQNTWFARVYFKRYNKKKKDKYLVCDIHFLIGLVYLLNKELRLNLLLSNGNSGMTWT